MVSAIPQEFPGLVNLQTVLNADLLVYLDGWGVLKTEVRKPGMEWSIEACVLFYSVLFTMLVVINCY